METKHNDGYTLVRRVKPFLKGLIRMEPLIEVAYHGMSGGYALPPGLEGQYLNRIKRSIEMPGKSERCFRMVRTGCSDGAQEFLSAMWLERFRMKMETFERRHASAGGTHAKEQGVRPDDPAPRSIASEITRLRILASELIVAEALSSAQAQLNLAGMLRHHGRFEAKYPIYSKVFHFQLNRVLASPFPSEDAKALIRTKPGSDCPFCLSA